MFSGDLTILFLTVNKMPERWVAFQTSHLLKAAQDTPIISISRIPMALGRNLIQAEPFSYWNIYVQMLRGARLATTPFVAMAEDDVLYTYEHFHEHRPPLDTVAFDMAWWSLLSWDPLFSFRNHRINATMIAPRPLLIEALEERMERYPDGMPDRLVGEVGRESVERRMGVRLRKSVMWFCHNPLVRLDHPTGTDTGTGMTDARGRTLRKIHKPLKAVEIPYWGRADDIVRIYDHG